MITNFLKFLNENYSDKNDYVFISVDCYATAITELLSVYYKEIIYVEEKDEEYGHYTINSLDIEVKTVKDVLELKETIKEQYDKHFRKIEYREDGDYESDKESDESVFIDKLPFSREFSLKYIPYKVDYEIAESRYKKATSHREISTHKDIKIESYLSAEYYSNFETFIKSFPLDTTVEKINYILEYLYNTQNETILIKYENVTDRDSYDPSLIPIMQISNLDGTELVFDYLKKNARSLDKTLYTDLLKLLPIDKQKLLSSRTTTNKFNL